MQAQLKPLIERPETMGLYRVMGDMLRPELRGWSGDKISIQFIYDIRDEFFHKETSQHDIVIVLIIHDNRIRVNRR